MPMYGDTRNQSTVVNSTILSVHLLSLPDVAHKTGDEADQNSDSDKEQNNQSSCMKIEWIIYITNIIKRIYVFCALILHACSE